MKDKHVDDLIDSLDASVFTGDFLFDKSDREEFKMMLERWSKEVKSYEEDPLP